LAPHLKKSAEQLAHVVLIDETGLFLNPLLRRTLAPQGCTPEFLAPAGHRHRLSVIAGISISPVRRNLGLYFQTRPNGYFKNTDVAAFVREVLRHLRGPVIVVWDNGSMHRGPAIRELLADFPRLSIENLPPYAPHFNPVEQLWSHLKLGHLCNFSPPTVEVLNEQTTSFLTGAKIDPLRLRSCYNNTPLNAGLTGTAKPEGQ
jgi:putative transposase